MFPAKISTNIPSFDRRSFTRIRSYARRTLTHLFPPALPALIQSCRDPKILPFISACSHFSGDNPRFIRPAGGALGYQELQGIKRISGDDIKLAPSTEAGRFFAPFVPHRAPLRRGRARAELEFKVLCKESISIAPRPYFSRGAEGGRGALFRFRSAIEAAARKNLNLLRRGARFIPARLHRGLPCFAFVMNTHRSSPASLSSHPPPGLQSCSETRYIDSAFSLSRDVFIYDPVGDNEEIGRSFLGERDPHWSHFFRVY